MRTFLTFLLMFTSISVMAVDPVPCEDENDIGSKLVEKAVEAQCAADAKKALRGMCMYVGSQDSDPNAQGKYKYMYQKKLLEASCVDIKKDSEEVIAKKVSNTWAANEAHLKCSNTQFDVMNGSLLKFAVSSSFDDFITDAIRWKVNLNKVDEVDGRTVLDYTKALIEKNKGNGLEPILKRYYENLKKAGAKHKSEL